MRFASFLVFFLSFNLFGYSYTAYSLITGDKTLSINPSIYCDTHGFIGTDINLSYGLNSKIDIWTTISLNNNTNASWSAMLRYDVFNGKIIAIKINDASFAPQIHLTFENIKYALQVNAGGQFTYKYMSKPSAFVILSPIIKIGTTGFDLFCDINSIAVLKEDYVLGSTRNKSFSLDLAPGFGFTVGSSLFSVAAPLMNITYKFTPTFGIWWQFLIGAKI